MKGPGLRPWVCSPTVWLHQLMESIQQCQCKGRLLLLQWLSNCWFTEDMLNGLETENISLLLTMLSLFLVLNCRERRERRGNLLAIVLSPVLSLALYSCFCLLICSCHKFLAVLVKLFSCTPCPRDASHTPGSPSVTGPWEGTTRGFEGTLWSSFQWHVLFVLF